jgi:integrase
VKNGGRGGIRTRGRVAPTSDFESGAFNQLSHPSAIVYQRLTVEQNVSIASFHTSFYTQMMKKPSSSRSPWEKTKYKNLRRLASNGNYYCWAKINGKPIQKSLKTKVISVALLRLGDEIAKARKSSSAKASFESGDLNFEDASKVFMQRIEGNPQLKPKTKAYYSERLKTIVNSWDSLPSRKLKDVTPGECKRWARKFEAMGYSVSVYNNSIGLLHRIFEIGIESNAIYSNPVDGMAKRKPTKKILQLPSAKEFDQLIKEVEGSDGAYNRKASILIRFLAYSGLRISEAANVTWKDVDLNGKGIHVIGDPVTNTKNWTTRHVPINDKLGEVIKEARIRWPPVKEAERVMPIVECRGSLASACEKVGIQKLTHHDLRHYFNTRCIESGVDIPTLAKWLGHKDGGVLLMKTYAHIGDEHSQEMAKKVKF